jgi:prolyl-tRNA synthetase
MKDIDGEEFELSSLSSHKLWELTQRWDNTELFKLKVNNVKEEDFCLTPTHEEEITNLINQNIINYKNLPLLTYQITRKYRFEKRPRFGLLRGREFLMKDAYSFDSSFENAMISYNKVNDAYFKIFTDLKIPFERAKADSGNIGGDLSQEWHFLHDIGEDIIYKCDHCGSVSNIEKTISLPKEDYPSATDAKVKYFLTKDNETLIAAYYPSDRKLIPGFIKDQLEGDDEISESEKIDFESTLTNDEVIEKFKGTEESDLILKTIMRVMDVRINNETNLPDFPLKTFQKNNFSLVNDLSIVEAQKDEICNACESGSLQELNSIEVGHTFYLGKRYSTPLKAKFVAPHNKMETYEMGCYGIGVTRIVGAIAEITKDKDGLIWPSSISPYDVAVVNSNDKNTAEQDEIVQELKNSGLTYQVDNRAKLGFGAKIQFAKMIGVPIILIVGKNYPLVELEIRGKRWNGTELYKTDFDTHQSEWQWTIEHYKGTEKHIVHKDHASKVIKSLLQDL